MEDESKTYGKYDVIYERGSKKTSDYGDVGNLQVGDIVSVSSAEGYQNLLVDRMAGSKWTRKIMSRATYYRGHLLTKSTAIDPRTIRRVLRLKQGEEHAPTMDEQDQMDKEL